MAAPTPTARWSGFQAEMSGTSRIESGANLAQDEHRHFTHRLDYGRFIWQVVGCDATYWSSTASVFQP